jgi:hypothetical protein
MTKTPEEIAAGLTPMEMMAVDFLARCGGDEIGVIETEEQMAAGLIYAQLAGQGLVEVPAFPVTRLTPLGKSVRTIIEKEQSK